MPVYPSQKCHNSCWLSLTWSLLQLVAPAATLIRTEDNWNLSGFQNPVQQLNLLNLKMFKMLPADLSQFNAPWLCNKVIYIYLWELLVWEYTANNSYLSTSMRVYACLYVAWNVRIVKCYSSLIKANFRYKVLNLHWLSIFYLF